MKKTTLLLIVLLTTLHWCKAQTTISPAEADLYKTLAEEKAAILQVELSLTEEQTERVVAKIFKYSIIAKDVLQSELATNDKTKELHALAAEQKEEIRSILSPDQYDYYKRRNGAISSSK